MSMFLLTALATANGAEELQNISYDRGLSAQSGAVHLKVGARVQARWTSMDALGVRRARISSRVAVADRAELRFQGAVETGAFEVKDLYATAHIAPGWVSLDAGQMKEPFSRQQIASSGKMQFLERAITDEAFHAGRGVGAWLHGGDGFRWRAGFSSADGAQDVRPVARLDWDPRGAAFDEVDLDGGPLRTAVGVSARGAAGEQPTTTQADTQLKWRGASVTAGVYLAPSDVGGHLQAGYCHRGRVQLAARVAQVNDSDEQRLAATYFLDGYRFYFQLDGGRIGSPEGELWEARSQVQIVL